MSSLLNKKTVAEQNILYYDRIATEYDRILEHDHLNEMIREKLKRKFIETVPPGVVLDFGGGTGKDLSWLTENGFRVIFCEPSSKMKQKAVALIENRIPANKILILPENKTDFIQWNTSPPFQEKVDAVLANFAVLNCISDIKTLFNNLAPIMKSGGNLLALILDNRRNKMMQYSRRKATISSIFKIQFRFSVHFGPYKHTVYIHTDKAITTAIKDHFDLKSKENWNSYGFSLLQLVKK